MGGNIRGPTQSFFFFFSHAHYPRLNAGCHLPKPSQNSLLSAAIKTNTTWKSFYHMHFYLFLKTSLHQLARPCRLLRSSLEVLVGSASVVFPPSATQTPRLQEQFPARLSRFTQNNQTSFLYSSKALREQTLRIPFWVAPLYPPPSATMASPELAITKATLSATLFRADPTSLNRAAVDTLFTLLDDAIIQCSRQNVQV